jgi:hypothetical protein
MEINFSQTKERQEIFFFVEKFGDPLTLMTSVYLVFWLLRSITESEY